MPKLTSHVLDTYHGKPAAAMTIELWRLGEIRTQLLTVETNQDGRSPAALLEGDTVELGEYELLFHVRDYFRKLIGNDDACPFLNIVPVRFSIYAATQHYHVPLLVSPWAYSTYRGS